MTNPVATRELSCVSPEGEAFDITIQIGRPTPISDRPESDWRCPVTIPFGGEEREIYGVDSWQALCLALSLVHAQLAEFLRRGGKLYHPGGTEEFTFNDFPGVTGHS
ncbi:MAG: hypothetical protein ACAI37_24410 [Chthoniobacter sp.]